MAYTLSNLIRDAMTHMGRTQSRMLKATATGTTTTFIDTNIEEGWASDDDDMVKNGTLLITYDAAGAGAAPEGEMQRISSYSENASQFTVDTVYTVAPDTGDEAMFINSEFPLIELKRQANSILQDLGYIALIDTSITYDDAVYEYTLPVGLKYDDPIQILYANSDATDRIRVSNFHIIPAAPGTAGKLVLHDIPDGRQVYIIYNGVHPTLTTYSSPLSETIDPALASWALADAIWRWKEPTDPFEIQRKNEAATKAVQFKAERPIWKPDEQTKWNIGGQEYYHNYTNDVGTVHLSIYD